MYFIWISPDWNVNERVRLLKEYKAGDLNITRLECKSEASRLVTALAAAFEYHQIGM